MIDPEIRDIITPQLTEGEELLWAEKIEASVLAEKIALYEGSVDKMIPFAIAFIFIALLLLVTKNWTGLAFAMVVIAVGWLIESPVEILEVKRLEAHEVRAYALTDKHVFELDAKMKVLKKLTVSLSDVSGIDSVNLRKVAGKWRSYSMEFLKNPPVTINYIDAQIKRLKQMQ